MLSRFLNKCMWRTKYYTFLQTYEKRKKYFTWKCHVTKPKKETYENNSFQLQKHHLFFLVRGLFFLPATSVPSHSPMINNTTASLDKSTGTDYVDFGKCQDRFGQFSWSKNDSNFLGVKVKVFKKDENRDFRLVQNLTMGEEDRNQFIQLRNELALGAENFGTEENLFPRLVLALPKDMDKKL